MPQLKCRTVRAVAGSLGAKVGDLAAVADGADDDEHEQCGHPELGKHSLRNSTTIRNSYLYRFHFKFELCNVA